MARHKNDPLKNALAFERPVRELDLQLEEIDKKLAAFGAELDEEKTAERQALLDERGTTLAERDAKLDEMVAELGLWQRIQLSRHVDRPVTADYVEALCTDVLELHGDRTYGDDKAIYTALATMGERRILVVAHRKGRTTEERIACNWGCAHPEGYRKALRCMQLAARLGHPIVTLINTPGAYPGIGAEERGQAAAIAWNILEMSALPVPVVSVVIGEGGSGGALGIGVCDRLLVLENSYYSVISPEGCASILWKDGSRAEEAASALKLTTTALGELGVADEIVPEPKGGANRDKAGAAALLGEALVRHLDELEALPVDELLARRRSKYRHIGLFRGAEALARVDSFRVGPSATQDAS
ncbi:MAG: acetyl-CoA carboxylase carboxyltransferase subunit alpha [Planctomycetes bacterium]|nr:acetyl-CoA carboxylase carboxyltransferase subunit alpha [Planctomycetota bacterium]